MSNTTSNQSDIIANSTIVPYATYESNVPAGAVLASLVGVSLIAWFVQSILMRFKHPRIHILILLSHMTMFVHLVLRAALPTDTRNSKAATTTMTVLLAVSIRTIIFSNYDFLVRVRELKKSIARALLIGPALVALASSVLMIPAGALSFNPDTFDMSIRLRKASAVIILGIAVIFYPVWFGLKLKHHMQKQGITLLMISSIFCLFVTIYLVVVSIPRHFLDSNKRELWDYIFQISPNIIALFTWSILHPLRSLKPATTEESKEIAESTEITESKDLSKEDNESHISFYL